jgi:hypothetical protein
MAYRDGLLPHGSCCHPEPVEGWQRNYWDRVIRDDAEHERIAKYIRDNPASGRQARQLERGQGQSVMLCGNI